jgi:hypothetical protein
VSQAAPQRRAPQRHRRAHGRQPAVPSAPAWRHVARPRAQRSAAGRARAQSACARTFSASVQVSVRTRVRARAGANTQRRAREHARVMLESSTLAQLYSRRQASVFSTICAAQRSA